MRHRVASKHFNRDSNARKSLFKNLVRSLIMHGQVTTSEARAKELKRLSDGIIRQAQDTSVASRRVLHQFFGARDVVNTLTGRIAAATKKRTSGFTHMEVVGIRRGDNTKLVKLTLVDQPEKMGTLKSGQTPKARPAKKAVTKAAPAEKPVAKKAAAPKKAVVKSTKKVTKK